jgi:pyridoxal phosphate enzyme (YggS family)
VSDGPDRADQSERADVLAAALVRVRERIAAACVAAGRTPEDVSLLPVTKTRPASDVALLVDLGLTGFGENRPQEAEDKAAALATLRPASTVRWHLVGRLQRNKARAAVGWASRIESVDSPRLVVALDKAVTRARDLGERGEPLSVLMQLSLDGDPERGGVSLDGAGALADRIAGCPGLTLDGVMAVAPLGTDPDRAFGTLAEAAARIRADHPRATVLSAGMTADLEAAVRNGSTCVRVGTALLGDRPLTFR